MNRQRIGELEDKIMEKEAEKNTDKKIEEYEGKIRELSDALKRNNLRIIGIPEEEERGKEKVHTRLTVAPGVGWGQTSGLTATQPTNASYSRQHRGSALQFHTTPGTIQNDETEEFPSKESPGNNNS